jgi:beta-phosphoglucomutase
MKPSGIIFDFDGVVVDSLGMHLHAWSEATLQVFRKELHDPSRFKGLSTATIAHLISQECGHPSQAQALAFIKRKILADSDRIPVLLPGIRQLIEELKNRTLPFGIASNAPRQFIIDSLKGLQLEVAVVVGMEDVKRGKPHPDPFNLCAQRLKLYDDKKASTLVFEDSFHGLEAAKASGMIPIGVTSQHTSEELKNAGALLVCETPGNVVSLGWLDHISLP